MMNKQYDNEMELEQHWTEILGRIYRKVKWSKMGSRSSYDIFEHRIEYSKHEISIPEVIQRLCNKLSIQAPAYGKDLAVFLDSLEYLRKHEKDALHMVRTRGKLLTLLAAKKSKELKSVDNDDKKIKDINNQNEVLT